MPIKVDTNIRHLDQAEFGEIAREHWSPSNQSQNHDREVERLIFLSSIFLSI